VRGVIRMKNFHRRIVTSPRNVLMTPEGERSVSLACLGSLLATTLAFTCRPGEDVVAMTRMKLKYLLCPLIAVYCFASLLICK